MIGRFMRSLYDAVWPTPNTAKSADDAYDAIMERMAALFADKECDAAEREESSYMPNAEFFRYEGEFRL